MERREKALGALALSLGGGPGCRGGGAAAWAGAKMNELLLERSLEIGEWPQSVTLGSGRRPVNKEATWGRCRAATGPGSRCFLRPALEGPWGGGGCGGRLAESAAGTRGAVYWLP